MQRLECKSCLGAGYFPLMAAKSKRVPCTHVDNCSDTEGTKPCRSWAQSTTDFTTRGNLWHLLPLIIKAGMRCFHGVEASWGVKQEESAQQLLYPAGDGCTPSNCTIKPNP